MRYAIWTVNLLAISYSVYKLIHGIMWFKKHDVLGTAQATEMVQY